MLSLDRSKQIPKSNLKIKDPVSNDKLLIRVAELYVDVNEDVVR